MAKKTDNKATTKDTKKTSKTDVSKLITKTVKDTQKKTKEKDIKSKEKVSKPEEIIKKAVLAEEKTSKAKKSAAPEKKTSETTKSKTIKKAASEAKTESKEPKETVAKKEPKAANITKKAEPVKTETKAESQAVKKTTKKTPAKKKTIITKLEDGIKKDIKKSAQSLEEEKIAQSKYEIEPPSAHIEPSLPIEETKELPETYGETKIVALIRDPEWVFLYWDISEKTRNEYNIPKNKHHKTMAVRIYDVTGINFDGKNAISWYDIRVNDYSISWYLRLPEPGRSYIIDLGVYSNEGIFQTIARSNSITMPPADISPHTDEEWMHITEETFMELFRLSGGLSPRDFVGSENVALLLGERLRQGLFSEALSSGAVSSFQPEKRKIKGFWLIADAELIIYGATEPTAKVKVQGEPVTLTPQGTFSMRFALPDGSQEIPIVAINEDGDDTRQIIITVKRVTK